MTRVTLDDELRKKLLNCTEPLELCDATGLVLARLTPSMPLDENDWEELTIPASEEEIQRQIDSNEPTFTTEELIDKIKRF